MKRQLSRLLLATFVAFCVGAYASPPANAAVDSVPFGAFGYRDTIYEAGPNASLSVFIPVTRGLRSIRLHAPITISPQVDPRSSIVVMANDVPVSTVDVKSAGRTPTIDVAIPVPQGASSLNIALVGRLFILGDICADPRSNSVWFTVSKDSRLTVTSDDRASNDQVADFLNQYGGEFDIVNRASGDDARTALMQLGYRLHQIERWRRVDVDLTSNAHANARRVVLGSFPQDIAVRGTELDVTPRGVGLLDDRIDHLLIARQISDAQYTPQADRDKKLSINDLGVTTRTLRGSGELPFDIPMTYGAFGGVPQHLRLHVDLAHTPLHPADRAYVQVLVNNTLIGAYDMNGKTNVEQFDVPLDVDAVSSSNVVRVVPTFFYERDACKGNFPSFTATLSNNTNFQWDGIDHRQLSVGEFVRAVSGKVVVLVDNNTRTAAAFALVSAIGTVNSSVRSIDVRTFDGSVPGGYDYAIVVGSGDKVAALKAPLQVTNKDFSINAADGQSVRYRADYSQPFGVLETAFADGTPTLIATYWKDPAILAGIARLQPDDLGAQTDDVLVYNAREATYTETRPRVTPRGDNFALKIPAIIGIFALLLIGVVVVASRRKV